MSRTFRRKNIEQAMRHLRRGSKTNGYYTASDYKDSGYKRFVKEREWEEDGVTIIERKVFWWHTNGVPTYRPMTKEERRDQWLWLHGESKHANAWTPGRWYRNNRENQHRSQTKQELIKYLKDPDNYEPMVYEEPQSCLWDWS